jgi:hypothetical protein
MGHLTFIIWQTFDKNSLIILQQPITGIQITDNGCIVKEAFFAKGTEILKIKNKKA